MRSNTGLLPFPVGDSGLFTPRWAADVGASERSVTRLFREQPGLG
ncbi:AraC-like DNA-binding protein [Polaromonas sp. CG_9.7]|nr:AraC-like DNA-binding protein [Polaromonas sp. CG_9.7]MBG6114679.1 AraC-like DNA-binding protein [Polaromonas sp. CG_9.2]MDH6185156.1 AraC-like DNA-binding protein [Polaromonas sp. CG_23.6]